MTERLEGLRESLAICAAVKTRFEKRRDGEEYELDRAAIFGIEKCIQQIRDRIVVACNEQESLKVGT